MQKVVAKFFGLLATSTRVLAISAPSSTLITGISSDCQQPNLDGHIVTVGYSQFSDSQPVAQLVFDYPPNHPFSAGKMDPLTITASELQDLLQAGKTTSVEIVKMYLDQIQKHNLDGMKIRAIISTPPKDTILAYAQELDEERATKGPRGPLHGIPLLVKV